MQSVRTYIWWHQHSFVQWFVDVLMTSLCIGKDQNYRKTNYGKFLKQQMGLGNRMTQFEFWGRHSDEENYKSIPKTYFLEAGEGGEGFPFIVCRESLPSPLLEWLKKSRQHEEDRQLQCFSGVGSPEVFPSAKHLAIGHLANAFVDSYRVQQRAFIRSRQSNSLC